MANSSIHEIPTYAGGYSKTFAVNEGLTEQVLRQPQLTEQQQSLALMEAAQSWLSQEGQPTINGQSSVYGSPYAVISDAQTHTLLKSDTNIPFISHNFYNGTVTIEEPLTDEDQSLAHQVQESLLTTLTAQQNVSQAAAQSPAQLELG